MILLMIVRKVDTVKVVMIMVVMMKVVITLKAVIWWFWGESDNGKDYDDINGSDGAGDDYRIGDNGMVVWQCEMVKMVLLLMMMIML